LAGGFGFGINLLQAAVQVPVLLHYWGAEKMGIWLSLGAVGALMTTLDVGHHAYLGNKMNRLCATDHAAFIGTLGSGVRISMVVGFVPFVIIAIGYWGLNLGGLISVSPDILSQKSIAFLLVIQAVQWSYTFAVGGVLGHLYVAKGDYARFAYWGAVYRFLGVVCLLASVSLGLDIVGAMIVQVVFCIVYHMFQWADLRFRYPDCYPWWIHGSLAEGWRNYVLSLVLTFNNFGQQVLAQGLVLLVARSMGSTAVPLYASTRTMVNVAQAGNGIIINPIVPEIGRLDAMGEHSKIDRLLKSAVTLSSLVVLVVIVVALWCAEPVYDSWTRGKLQFDGVFLMLLLTSVAVRMAGSALMGYLISVNDLIGQTWATWLNAGIVFGLGALLMPIIGLRGLGIAMVAGEIFGSLILPFWAVRTRWHRILGHDSGGLGRIVLSSGLILIFSGAAVALFFDHKITVGGIVLVLALFYLVINRTQFSAFKKVMAQL
jgi:O-antigen/teichoic acid export membrane protein